MGVVTSTGLAQRHAFISWPVDIGCTWRWDTIQDRVHKLPHRIVAERVLVNATVGREDGEMEVQDC